MGYITKDIAIIDEPKIVSLAGSPNFVTFASKAAAKTYIDVDIKVVATPATPIERTLLRVYEAGGTLHEFRGTTDPEAVGGSTFLISSDPSDTAENLREALVAVPWIDANFEIRIPATISGDTVTNGDTVNITGKGAGADFRLNITAPNNVSSSAYAITWTSNNSTDADTIKGNASTVEIEVDIYEDPAIFLGFDDRPITENAMGRKTVSLQKTYAGDPVWFDLNGVFSKYRPYLTPAPSASGWFDTGTVKAYRFIAKVRAANNFNFYISNALYAVSGYARLSEPVDMAPYVFNGNTFKLLSNAPTLPYVRGQKAYLNFIYADPQRGAPAANYPILRVLYKFYSRGGNFLGSNSRQAVRGISLRIANSVLLQIDGAGANYPNAGEVRVSIEQDGVEVSNELRFRILPECLHTLREFTFLNKLGGWDVFNFNTEARGELRREHETYFKTTTPQSVGGPENVYSVDVGELYAVEGAPVSDEVAEWLREFAASPVILDENNRQVLIQDFALNVSEASQGMHVPSFKYRLNDTYTND